MMKETRPCPNCGKEILVGAITCSYCYREVKIKTLKGLFTRQKKSPIQLSLKESLNTKQEEGVSIERTFTREPKSPVRLLRENTLNAEPKDFIDLFTQVPLPVQVDCAVMGCVGGFLSCFLNMNSNITGENEKIIFCIWGGLAGWLLGVRFRSPLKALVWGFVIPPILSCLLFIL